MFSLEVVPGERIGCFVLGLGINDVLHLLQDGFLSQRPKTNIIYHETKSIHHDIVLNVVDMGMNLIFDALSQRLVSIQVFDLAKLGLRYAGSAFGSGHREKGTLLELYRLFGPTFAGSFDNGTYSLSYRGIKLCFPLPSDEFIPDLVPLEPKSGVSPSVNRLCVYHGLDEAAPEIVSSFSSLNYASVSNGVRLSTINSFYMSVMDVDINIGIHNKSMAVKLGAPAQEVIVNLGQPSKIYFKKDERMKIHHMKDDSFDTYSLVEREICFRAVDYFYNYFDLGIDVLFDALTHAVIKIVIHCNQPGHPDFSQYNKCNFNVHIQGNLVTPEMKWPEIEEVVGSCGKPMIHDTGTASNPFGGSCLYASQGCVWEIMKSGNIASFTIF